MDPLLAPRDVERLRAALEVYTVESVQELVGPEGESAFGRGDLAGVARALAPSDTSSVATLTRLFLLGLSVPEGQARAALAPWDLDAALSVGLLRGQSGQVAATLDLRPYAEADGDCWWVISDFGSDVRPGPVSSDHVLGIGAASLTLAQSTVRRPVVAALDVGTGCGIQALHLSRHATRICATDISERALRLAATTAALNDQHWDLRAGSLLDPVAGERFDMVVANPPFVVSPGWADDGFDCRDSGYSGDEVCQRLVRGLPRVLAESGTGQLLANWVIDEQQPWEERLGGWLAGSDCSAWVWQREVAEPSEYVSLWLRDAGEEPGSPRWHDRRERWLGWFDATGVVAVGMGLITVRRTGGVTSVLCEDVPQPVEQPCGALIDDWFGRQQWLARCSDDQLMGSALHAAPDIVLSMQASMTASGWSTVTRTLEQRGGMGWVIDTDESVAELVAACDGTTVLAVPVALLAAALGRPVEQVAPALLPVVRDLVSRGLLLPG